MTDTSLTSNTPLTNLEQEVKNLKDTHDHVMDIGNEVLEVQAQSAQVELDSIEIEIDVAEKLINITLNLLDDNPESSYEGFLGLLADEIRDLQALDKKKLYILKGQGYEDSFSMFAMESSLRIAGYLGRVEVYQSQLKRL